MTVFKKKNPRLLDLIFYPRTILKKYATYLFRSYETGSYIAQADALYRFKAREITGDLLTTLPLAYPTEEV